MSSKKYRYRAFLSYASPYVDWVAVLHGNLEAALGDGTVFFDRQGIRSGESWTSKLQRALDESERVILIATPEAFASKWVLKELESQFAASADHQVGRRILPLRLVETSWPPFLRETHFIDFEGARGSTYVERLNRLLSEFGKEEPLTGIEEPPAVVPELDPVIRRELVELIAEPLALPIVASGLEATLNFERGYLSGFPSLEVAAGASLVRAQGTDSAEAAAKRLLDTIAVSYQGLVSDLERRVERLRASLNPRREQSLRSDLLMTYLSHVEQRYKELPSFISKKARDSVIEHVFVELQLGRDEKLEMAQMPHKLADLIALSREDNPWVTGRWAVRGVPGSGKTTLLRQYACALAQEARLNGGRRVPLLVSLPALLRQDLGLLEYVERRCSKVREMGLVGLLERLGHEGRLVVLLDSLDEVQRESQDEALDLARDLATRWPTASIVLTSRPIGYRRPSREFIELDVMKLDRDRRKELLARWFVGPGHSPDFERAEACLRELEEDPHLQDLSAVPLYLTWMAMLFDDDIRPSRHRPTLYDQILERLYDNAHRDDGVTEPLPLQKDADRALQQIALEWTEGDRTEESLFELESRLNDDTFEPVFRRLSKYPAWAGRPRAFLTSVERTGVLGAHEGDAEENWRFWHKSFQEALTAKAVERKLLEVGREDVVAEARGLGKHDISRWAEPYSLLAGRIKDADELIIALTEVNRPLGLRALATAQGLQPKTLTHILGLSDDWRQRSEVIRHVPEQVGVPERAISLVEQIGSGLTNGNDLYFLHDALDNLAKSHPKWVDRACTAQERLYCQGTVADGIFSREQWTEIPSGDYLMGSLVGEGGNDELPQRRARISMRLRVAIAPVTVEQFLAFDPSHKPHFKHRVPDEELGQHPVVNVTWYEAVSFCRWLSNQFEWARGARLPTEAQWEYMCRAGTQTAWSHGNSERKLTDFAWFSKNADGTTHPVRLKKANPWGLHDMHGNVWEWCQDWKGYGSSRVIRGGSFWDVAGGLRSACRFGYSPGSRSRHRGFRVVLPVAGE